MMSLWPRHVSLFPKKPSAHVANDEMSSTGRSHQRRYISGSPRTHTAAVQATASRIPSANAASAPPVRRQNPQRYRRHCHSGKDFAHVASGAGTPRSARPAQAMPPVVSQRIVSDVMFNDGARQDHRTSENAMHAVADDKVFRKVGLHLPEVRRWPRYPLAV